jgi:hypothetical protein
VTYDVEQVLKIICDNDRCIALGNCAPATQRIALGEADTASVTDTEREVITRVVGRSGLGGTGWLMLAGFHLIGGARRDTLQFYCSTACLVRAQTPAPPDLVETVYGASGDVAGAYQTSQTSRVAGRDAYAAERDRDRRRL